MRRSLLKQLKASLGAPSRAILEDPTHGKGGLAMFSLCGSRKGSLLAEKSTPALACFMGQARWAHSNGGNEDDTPWHIRRNQLFRERFKGKQGKHLPLRKPSSMANGMYESSSLEAIERIPLENPMVSQPLHGSLNPTCPEEMKVAPLLARTDLLITRNIEWANLLIGFEQENRYAIMDPRQSLAHVGFIVEQSHWLFRQFLRTRRPFVASIFDATGQTLFTVRRPAWLINSTIYIEVDGKLVGHAHRRWHLWKRVYDLYLGNDQFAVVENPGFWDWTFTLKDQNGGILAEIDRHFRGFGFEFLTDAGQYAIRFGDMAPDYIPSPNASYTHVQSTDHKQETLENESEALPVIRPLTLLERAVALALAVSLDNDYFSRHSRWGVPFFFPFFGGDEE